MEKHKLVALWLVCLSAGLLFAGAVGTGIKKPDFTRTTIDIGIVVSDVEKTARFYKNALGFTEAPGFDVSSRMAGDSGLARYMAFSVRVLALDNAPTATKIKIMQFPEADPKKVDNRFIHSSLGFSYLTVFVSDMNAAVQRLENAGAAPVKEPYRLGGSGNFLTLVKDPDGNIIELVGPGKSPASNPR